MLAVLLATSGVSSSSGGGGDDGSKDKTLHPDPFSVHQAHSVRQLVLKGERHMSTNFMTSILRQSFGTSVCSEHTTGGTCADCDTTADEPTSTTYCCWKHGYANSQCHGWYSSDGYPAHVFMERSVYPWLLAMHDMPYEYDGNWSGTFSEFIRQPFAYTPTSSNGYYSQDVAQNPVKLWNQKLGSYHEFMQNTSHLTSVNVTFETLYSLDNLRVALQPLLDAGYQLVNGETEIHYPPMSICPNNETSCENKFDDEWSLGEFLESKTYDAQELWRGLLTQDDVDWINSQVRRRLSLASRPRSLSSPLRFHVPPTHLFIMLFASPGRP